MKYISTRGQAEKLNFTDVAISGLASDGGLYVPEQFPHFTPAEIANMAGISYEELFFIITREFVAGEIPDADYKEIIRKSYETFRHKAICPLKQLGNQEFVLELFHGPTLAFKDFALQFLGNLFEYILSRRNENVTIIGATSGDTGSAAIEGCRHSKHVNMFILHPYNRVSEVQRRQMTTVIADNVQNIAVKGDFDACQEAVKEMFRDPSFISSKSKLIAVNSINWCRIMAQIVYYFYAALQLGAPARQIAFSVPTGNFGDIFAGYIAYKMGLPVKQLIVATNSNDILHRFVSKNQYKRDQLQQTLSPSMDIQVSSNFERLLFDIYDNDGAAVVKLMDDFKSGTLSVTDAAYSKVKKLFASHSVNNDETCKIIKQLYDETGEIIDPHTATGISAARKCHNDSTIPVVTLATAHPAKFPEAIKQAGLPEPVLPTYMQDIFDRKEKYAILENNINIIRKFIAGES